MHVTLCGRRYRFGFERLRGNLDGWCDPPDKPGKAITVSDDRLLPADELEVILHEALHACAWDHKEEWVTQAAADLARLLWRLGYRRHQAEA